MSIPRLDDSVSKDLFSPNLFSIIVTMSLSGMTYPISLSK